MTPLQQKYHRLIRATGVFVEEFYARNNPDVGGLGIDLLAHYIENGEAEGRAPSPFFDPGWYRLQMRRVPKDHCLLAHYLTIGDADGLQPMIGFDPAYVRSQAGNRQMPALVVFMRAIAAGKRLNPSQFFDYGFYLSENPDVAAARIDGYYHFVHVGANEGRIPSKDFSWYDLRERYQLSGTNSEMFRSLMLRWRHQHHAPLVEETPAIQAIQEDIRGNHRPSEFYEHHAAPSPEDTRRDCDVYAYYLTQFHRVPENDAWWGEGFTEWHNVVRGVPRFKGHYQPRVPQALGFYDLAEPAVMAKQVALARQAGLAGFAFYYYHFGTQRLLERPLERFLADPSLDTGFFLIWANESWSRRWDGSEAELLLEQSYPDDMPEMLAKDLARHFRDPRYRRIDGRPLLAIYRVGAIPRPARWLAKLRKAFKAEGEDPLIYMAQSFEDFDPRQTGCDGALEFPPHKVSRRLPLAMPQHPYGANPQMKVWDYAQFAEAAQNEADPEFPIIRACFPSWDNDSRRQGASSIIHDSTPEKFRAWLEALVTRAESQSLSPKIVCVNAWNEWGEGAYLEPDRRFGYAYLNAVQKVLHPRLSGSYRRVLLVGHDAFASGAQRLLLNLGQTLMQQFGVEVTFLLLRADFGYDGLVQDYRRVAETIVVKDNLADLIGNLKRAGIEHAIVNSSACSEALAALAREGLTTIQLIHELPGVLEGLGAGPDILASAGQVRRFVASTRSVAAMLEEVGVRQERIAILPQGQYRRVERLNREAARERLEIDVDASLVAALGYADWRKGADLFVATAEAALEAGDEIEFVWQGEWDPGTHARLEERIELLLASGRFRLLPMSTDIETLLSAADVYFLPSREDPLPSAAIEAWSCGLPVVAIAGTGGIPDLIAEDPMLGELAANADPTRLLQAIREALTQGSDEHRATWAAERFNWPNYVTALLRELYAPPSLDTAIVGHNHGRFADPRIASIVRQTMAPRAISYHDVNSTDGSIAAIHEAATRFGVHVIEAPDNAGRLYETWAALVEASDATYFHIAEGDDWIAPTMMQRCVDALEGSPDAAYAFVAVEWVDTDDNVLANHLYYPQSVIGEAVQLSEIPADALLASDFVVKNPVLTVSSVVWRRERLEALLRDNRADLDRLGFAFDWLLYLRAAAVGWSAVFVPEVLCRHRQHQESFASRQDLGRHALEIAKIYELTPASDFDAARAEYLDALG